MNVNPPPSQTFPKRFRLCDDEEIARVFKQGKRIGGAEFTVLFVANNQVFARLCVIVAKKNLRYANQRNTAKRVVREFFRVHKQELGGRDLVVLVNKSAATFAKKELHLSFERQWKKLISFLGKR